MIKLRKLDFYNVGEDQWLIDLPEYGYARLVYTNKLEDEFASLQRLQPVFLKTDLHWKQGKPYLEVDVKDEGVLFSFFIRSRRRALELTVEESAEIIGVSPSEVLAYENDLTLMTMNEFQAIVLKLDPNKVKKTPEVFAQ